MRYNGGEPTFDVVSTLFVDMLAQAFACDITRFGTLVLNDLPWDSASNAATDSLGYGLSSDFHNNVAHKYNTHGFDWEGKLGNRGDATTGSPSPSTTSTCTAKSRGSCRSSINWEGSTAR